MSIITQNIRDLAPYQSFGNGAAMRVSPAGILAGSLQDAADMARRVTMVTHDHPEGIKVEDCVRVSNHLTRLFAVEGIAYERLEVSSPGLDRPVRTLEEFTRFKGQLAKVKLLAMVDGRKRFMGRIAEVDGDSGVIFEDVQDAPAGSRIRVTLDQIDKARLEPEL